MNRVLSQAVVVTGASSGIGQSIAELLAVRGFRVFAGVRSVCDADRLRRLEHAKLEPLMLDVTDPSGIDAAATEVRVRLGDGRLNGLVNNAGIAVAGPLEFLALPEIHKQLEVNVLGPLAVCQAFLPLLRESGGRVVNVGSVSSRLSLPFLGPYAASKSALESLTDALRRELDSCGIRVSLIMPGTVSTPIFEKSMEASRRLQSQLPPAAELQYGRAMDKAFQTAEAMARSGIPPQRVARAVAHALTAARPKRRYYVGLQAKLVNWLLRFAPDAFLDWMVRQYMRQAATGAVNAESK